MSTTHSKSPGSRISQVRVNKKLRNARSACESPVSLSSLKSRNCYSTSPACCKRSNTETLPPLCGLDRVQGPMIYRPRQPSATAEVRAWYAVPGRWAVFIITGLILPCVCSGRLERGASPSHGSGTRRCVCQGRMAAARRGKLLGACSSITHCL